MRQRSLQGRMTNTAIRSPQLLLTLVLSWVQTTVVWSAPPTAAVSSRNDLVPPSWIDDATLRDVQFVGSKLAFAVGDHGAVWKTDDGGATWKAIPCPTTVSLSSVCFLTDQVGWVAGGEAVPYSHRSTGVVLMTKDGGRTWEPSQKGGLPGLKSIKFFSLEEGVVVGEPTSTVPTGVLRTSDGGQTWTPLLGTAPPIDGAETPKAPGIPSTRWLAASFRESALGVVAGREGRLALVADEQLLASKLPAQGLRSIRAVTIQHDESGWLAGDGGLVLRTTNGGVVWETPEVPLPEELRRTIDFRTVEVKKHHVWLAGSPGSVIWHSPDQGRNWERLSTGQSAPIHALRFANEQRGVAVGEFGSILMTNDGGQTWQSVRGHQRRMAVVSLQTRPSQVSATWITKCSGEQGYRSGVWVASRQDIGPAAREDDVDGKLLTAVLRSGGHAADVGWQLPMTVPGLDQNSDKLIAEWQKQTEGKLAETLIGSLVRQLRTWRPSVVLLDQPAKDRAAEQLVFDAALRAIAQAGDATRFTDQREWSNLEPWKVERVYMRLASATTGDTLVDLDEFLPRRRASVRLASAASESLLRNGILGTDDSSTNSSETTSRLAYRQIGTDGRPANVSATESGTREKGLSRDFFAGLAISPGSDARRQLDLIDEKQLERMQKLAERHRNFQAISHKSLDDPRMAGQMIGQMNGLVEGMDSRHGADVLRGLAAEYRERSLFELVEATNVELIRRYPNEPAAQEAMSWLIRFWTSGETAWQRVRVMSNDTQRVVGDPQSQRSRLQQAAAAIASGDPGVVTADMLEDIPSTKTTVSPGRMNRVELELDTDKSGKTKFRKKGTFGSNATARQAIAQQMEWRTGVVRDWHSQAKELAKQMEDQFPALFQSPEIQFPLGALHRASGSANQSDAIYRRFLSKAVDGPTRSLAEREVWAMFATAQPPQALAICTWAATKPKLDGLLSDPCWQAAREVLVTDNPRSFDDPEESTAGSTLTMFCYDNEFLFLGFSVPRREGTPTDTSPTTGRTRDADLSRFDRISLCLDTDRDYSTWYEFGVDQRGWTYDRCWEDRRWNPAWYVAAAADETHWRIEAAIPWSELTPTPPRAGSLWGIALRRTMPTVGIQSFVHPASLHTGPRSFGLLRFE